MLLLHLNINFCPVLDCGSYADIVFILDSSNSIDDEEYALMWQFVEDVVVELGEGDNARFGLTIFHRMAWVSDTQQRIFDTSD